MKTFKHSARQGDVLITRIDKIPENIVRVETNAKDHVVAHSETGHNHVIEADDIEFFHAANDDEMDQFISYIHVKNEGTKLRHLRSFKTHETLFIPTGLYRINRQREYIAEGFRKALD
jgi:hypothetical protein